MNPDRWPKQPLPWDEAGQNGGLEGEELRYRILSWKRNMEKQGLLLRSRDNILFGELGRTSYYDDHQQWISSQDLVKINPFIPIPQSNIENRMTPVPCVKKYKKWIRLMG